MALTLANALADTPSSFAFYMAAADTLAFVRRGLPYDSVEGSSQIKGAANSERSQAPVCRMNPNHTGSNQRP